MDQELRQEVLGAITDRQVAGLRLFLALAALVAIYIDPAQPDRFVELTYLSLVGYTLYSATIYLIARHNDAFSRWANGFFIGADLLVFTALISFSSGTNSIFYSLN